MWFVDSKLWNNISRRQLRLAIRSRDRESYAECPLPDELSKPQTFAFQTRAGKLGLLQVIGYTANPPGAKIRYRLAQTSSVAQLPVETSAVNAAAELKALQGQWKVVRVETGEHADATLMNQGVTVDASGIKYLAFGERQLELRDSVNGPFIPNLEYSVDPTAEPKAIDFREQSSPQRRGDLVASGIYKIDGNRLTLCLAKYLPALESQQRPRDFTIVPNSSNVLLTLERHRPSEDERALSTPMGRDWGVVGVIDNGESVPAAGLHCQIFNQGLEIVAGPPSNRLLAWGAFDLEPASTPKAITITPLKQVAERPDRPWSQWTGQLQGIYKLDGDGLTIAYRKNGPPPAAFESTPGSGVTLMVLRRSKTPKPATTMPGAFGGTGVPHEKAGEAAKPPAFRTAAVTRGDIVETISATGTLEPEEVVDVRGQGGGPDRRVRP